MTSAPSDKVGKRQHNRALRHKIRQAIHQKADILPLKDEISSTWDMDKDGKRRFDPRHEPKLMRK